MVPPSLPVLKYCAMANFTEQFSHFLTFKNSEYGLKVYLFFWATVNEKIRNYELLVSQIKSKVMFKPHFCAETSDQTLDR